MTAPVRRHPQPVLPSRNVAVFSTKLSLSDPAPHGIFRCLHFGSGSVLWSDDRTTMNPPPTCCGLRGGRAA